MDYRRFGDTILVRIDKDEEILTEMKKVALRENVKLAEVNALAALSEMTVALYDVPNRKFIPNRVDGPLEVTSLHGNINTMNGEYYTHIHCSAGNAEGTVFGGHLVSAVVSGTCEMFIRVIDGTVDRFRDEEVTGLNLWKFD